MKRITLFTMLIILLSFQIALGSYFLLKQNQSVLISDNYPLSSHGGYMPNFKKIKDGILIPLNGFNFLIATTTEGHFRLGIRPKGLSNPIRSIFLKPMGKAIQPYKVIYGSCSVGIVTAFGKLSFNMKRLEWTLMDPNGQTIISQGKISSSAHAQQIHLNDVGNSYGSGNYSSRLLIKDGSTSRVGNGVTDIPYLWNQKGYALLGVSENDDLPATWKKIGAKQLKWSFQGRAGDLYIWPAKTIYKGIQGLLSLTGKAALPPKWAFGFLQSRWGWKDKAYIEDALHNFRSRKLPVDAFIYDFEWYTDFPDYFLKANGAGNFPDFTFNATLFPKPQIQISNYKNRGIKFLGIRKPRLGDSAHLQTARKNDWLVKSEYNDRDMDFRNPVLRAWYIGLSKPLLDAGIDGWWNDEGEAYYTCYYWWNTAERDLFSLSRPGQRYFSINRSFSLGSQRLGYSTWNGDIKSEWRNLQETTADLLNWSLSGMFYGTSDIGGFGTVEPDSELVTRWFQAEAFFPIMRAHSNAGVRPRFPWLWDEDIIRSSLNLRYRLLPFIYSLGSEAYLKGIPIIRPLVMEFPTDPKVAQMTDQWLLGEGFMVAPILNPGGKRTVYLPKETWYNFYTMEKLNGGRKVKVVATLSEIPVYVRAGTILPIGPVLQHTAEKVDVPLEIRIYPGKNGNFNLLEDDGTSNLYIKGAIRSTVFKWIDRTKTLSWEVKNNYHGDNIYTAVTVVMGGRKKTIKLLRKGQMHF